MIRTLTIDLGLPAPFETTYMERALLTGVLIAIPLSLLGAWVVILGRAFFAHAVGVATFPGVVIGLGVPALGPFVGSLLAAAAFTLAVAGVERDHRVSGGAVTGLALSSALALGAVLLVSVFATSTPVESVLFGSLLAISDADVWRCLTIALVVLAGLSLMRARLAGAAFDRPWAAGAGARPGLVDVALPALLALAVVAALPAVGSLLVSGLVLLPAATARLLTGRLGPLMALSLALGLATTVAGLVAARRFDLPPGAAIATVGGIGFAAAALIHAGAAAIRRRPAGAAA
jgi:ABC-type Mn2+/Zn2+ transport system permease subunit